MIQRKQTLYWAIAFILQVVYILVPYASLEAVAGTYRLNVLGLYEHASGDLLFRSIPLLVLTALVVLMLLVVIFLYKRRQWQMSISIWAIVLELGQVGMMVYYFLAAIRHLNGANSFALGFFLPVVAAFFTYLGYAGVRRDIRFLQRMSRLR